MLGILDHVLGSVAEVERVWSWVRYVLTTQRARIAPVLFEAIMFLKFNRDLWDEKTHTVIIQSLRDQKRVERVLTGLRRLWALELKWLF